MLGFCGRGSTLCVELQRGNDGFVLFYLSSKNTKYPNLWPFIQRDLIIQQAYLWWPPHTVVCCSSLGQPLPQSTSPKQTQEVIIFGNTKTYSYTPPSQNLGALSSGLNINL